MNKKILWVLYHGGFDLALLLRLVSNSLLPIHFSDFYLKLGNYFNSFIDLKFAAN